MEPVDLGTILNVGTTSSGKTCYFYAMLYELMKGVEGFHIRIKGDADNKKLCNAVEILSNTTLQRVDREPQPNRSVERYTLNLLYGWQEIIGTLTWIEYDGENVKEQDKKFMTELKDANCLLVSIDGEMLKFDKNKLNKLEQKLEQELDKALEELEEELEEELGEREKEIFKKKKIETEFESEKIPKKVMKRFIKQIRDEQNGEEVTDEVMKQLAKCRSVAMARYLKELGGAFFRKSGMHICNALSSIVDNNKPYPPVCILITKYDLVPKELQDNDILPLFVKYCFPTLFIEDNNNRIVTICPVSIGEDFATNGPLEPMNVHVPICFITYLMQKKYIKEKTLFIDEQNNRGVLSRIFSSRPSLTEREKQQMIEQIYKTRESQEKVLERIESIPLYINGKKKKWRDN